jgi:regulator of sirC expression with transglutaminase-like and TPR domain
MEMITPRPCHCNKRAFACLAKHLPVLNTTSGLLRAAVAVSMHEMDRADPDAVETQIQTLTTKINHRIKSSNPSAVMAHAHDILFEERGLKGNKADYHNPRNSYLPVVLRTGRGLPITLSLIYKSVVEPLGVSVFGINAPGHFLIGIDGSGTDHAVQAVTIIDPFGAGRMLSHDEAVEVCQQTIGDVTMPDDPLSPATHKQWLVRIIQNLMRVFDRLGQQDDLAAMLEMRELVLEHGPDT